MEKFGSVKEREGVFGGGGGGGSEKEQNKKSSNAGQPRLPT